LARKRDSRPFRNEGGLAAAGQDVDVDVAAQFGPLVVLLGEQDADEANQGVAAGKIPTTSVRRRISRLRRSCGVLGQTCRKTAFGNAVNARMLARAAARGVHGSLR
jgi:hypothetical protein